MPSPQHLIFDFDGTLIDSAPSILAGFAAALAEQKVEAKLPLDKSLIGPPLKETLRRISGQDDEAVLQALIDAFKAHYDTEGYKASAVYEGVPEMLRALKAAGYTLHIATNKRLLPTEKILAYLGWTPLFDTIYALDKVSPAFANKGAMIGGQLAAENIPATDALYLGDKAEDGHASDANTLPFIAVAWGYGDFVNGEMRPHWRLAQTPAGVSALLG